MNYKTISSPVSCSFIEKRSEFIGHLCPVQSTEQAVDFINKIKSEHRKAKHNVYAYILRHDNTTRYSDDGEPQGTAGVPVLDVLLKQGLTDICCVVTRYFGGILLGGGGLVRAYSHSAALAVENAEILNMYSCSALRLTMDYDLYGKVSYVLPDFEIKQTDADFGNNVILTVNVKDEKHDALCKKLTDVTNGKIQIELLNKLFDNFAF
ncbi:MAG: YigZ family protein [Porcipelethomonas sp.]